MDGLKRSMLQASLEPLLGRGCPNKLKAEDYYLLGKVWLKILVGMVMLYHARLNLSRIARHLLLNLDTWEPIFSCLFSFLYQNAPPLMQVGTCAR